MAGLCSDSVLTGQDGLIQFKPAGTSVCIPDYTPFDGDCIAVGCEADFRVGDCIYFTAEDGAQAPSEISALTLRGSISGGTLNSDFVHSFVVGNGYTPGTYTSQPVIGYIGNGVGTSGSGARINVVVASNGQVESATLVSGGSGYAVGDQITVALPGGSGFYVTIDSITQAAPSGATTYYVVGLCESADGEPGIQISANENGTPISFAGTSGGVIDPDSGDRVDSPAPAHLTITLCDYITTCNVRSFSVDFSRDELDVTTLPCGTANGCDNLAQFRKTQAGYASATGTLEVYFTCDQTTMSNRLLGSSLLKTQTGAAVKLYVCTDFDGDGNAIDENSLYIEAEISLLGLSFSVNPDDVTTATINFGITRMIEAFGTKA